MSLSPTLEQLRDTKPVKYMPDLLHGRICKCYDGDSYWMAAYLSSNPGSRLFYFPLRLRGIDTPELRTKSDKEKKLAVAARDYAQSLVLEKEVVVKNVELEKYGRYLCDVFVDGNSLCELLIAAGHGRRYDGGTRLGWD